MLHEDEYMGRAFTGPIFPCTQTLGTKYERPPPPSKYVLGLYSHITVPSWLILFDSECSDARGYTRVPYRTLFFFLSVNAHELFYNEGLVLPDVRIPGEVTSVRVGSITHSKKHEFRDSTWI